jgi:hypothetical protein
LSRSNDPVPVETRLQLVLAVLAATWSLRRRGLLPRVSADRKSWVALRRNVFHGPPTERNRV